MKQIKSATLLIAIMLAMASMSYAAAKQIIIMNVTRTEGTTSVRYVLWITTTVPVPRPGTISIWPGASAAENAAIAAGTTIEISAYLQVPQGSTKAQIQTRLQTIFTQAQGEVQATPQGCFFDGTTWSC